MPGQPHGEARTARLSLAAISASSVIVVGVVAYALMRGQDTNWDQRNYHYYSGWALVHGRSLVDLWPAQIQTFFNPLASLLPYALIARLPPIVAGAALALLQSVNVLLVAAIAVRLYRPSTDVPRAVLRRWLVVGSAVTIGATAPTFVSEIGTTFPDSTTSIAVLAGLLALVLHVERRSAATALVAGLLFGAAAGLKLTNGIYLLGAIAYPWWVHGNRWEAARTLLAFLIAAAPGIVLTHGYWSLQLWSDFGSPVFPLYNAVFRSPWFEPTNFIDRRFLPGSLLDALTYPFQWLVGQYPSGELAFRDARFAVAELVAPLAVGLIILRRRRPTDLVSDKRALVIGFACVSFALWLWLFGVSRYLVPLELLSGVALVSLVGAITRERWLAAVSVALAVVLVLWTMPADWGHLPWRNTWFGVGVPTELQRDDELFVMYGGAPTAYVIPFLPEGARFVRIGGNMALVGVSGREALRDQARRTIASHSGPIYTLAPGPPLPADLNLLAEFGLYQSSNACVSIQTRVDLLVSCPVGPLP